MQRKQIKPGLFVGGPTVMTVLMVLCFAAFGLLSLTRAASDHRYAVRASRTVSAYYLADGRAEEVMALSAPSFRLPPAQAGAELEVMLNESGLSARFDQESGVLRFQVPAGDLGVLEAHIRLRASGAGAAPEVMAWRVQPDTEQDQPDYLPVYQARGDQGAAR